MKPLIIGLSYDMKTIFLVFATKSILSLLLYWEDTLEQKWINLENFDRTVTKFLFPYKPFGIYAKLFALKLSLACLIISLIELLKFSQAWIICKMVCFGIFYCPYRPLIYVRNKWQPETKPLRTPYMLVRLELKPLLRYIISYHWYKKQSSDQKMP